MAVGASAEALVTQRTQFERCRHHWNRHPFLTQTSLRGRYRSMTGTLGAPDVAMRGATEEGPH